MSRWVLKYIFLILLLISGFSIAATSNQHRARVFFSASSASMEPAIKKSEVIFNSPYEDGQSPRRGDVVVFNYPDNNGFTYVKRVIGLPGERVEIRGGLVYINGSRLEEPYLFHVKEGAVPDLKGQFSGVFDMNEKVIPEKHYFLLGDNRYNSLDSRIFGPVGGGDILGVAIPWHEIEKDESRIGAALARYVFEVNKSLPMKFEDGAIFQSISQDGNTIVVFNFKYLRGDDFSSVHQTDLKGIFLSRFCASTMRLMSGVTQRVVWDVSGQSISAEFKSSDCGE